MAGGPIIKKTITDRLNDADDGLEILPRPKRDAIGPGTADLRVGSVFLLARRSTKGSIDARHLNRGSQMFDELRLSRAESTIVIQPRQFVLASTFEYICMPNDLGANIQSRSTYGRMGIIAATASYIGPGYKGSPTLELVNVGEVPIMLAPHVPICQLVFLPAVSDLDCPPSRYHLATRPLAYIPTLSERLERTQIDDQNARSG